MIIPTFKSLEAEDITMQFLRKTMLRKILDTIKPMTEGKDHQHASVRALIALEEIVRQRHVAENTYFGRVWTLAERMARDGQNDRVCHWLPLTLFMGMGIDTLLNLIEGLQEGKDGEGIIPDRSKIYLKMIGPEARELMISASQALAGPVTDCLTDIEPQVRDLAAECFISLAGVWAKGQSPDFKESPSKDWLKRYLTMEEEFSLYLAWSKADRVWAIFSYFSAQNPEQLDKQLHTKAALDRLSRCAGAQAEEVEMFAEDALFGMPEQLHIIARVPSVSAKSMTNNNKVHPFPLGSPSKPEESNEEPV